MHGEVDSVHVEIIASNCFFQMLEELNADVACMMRWIVCMQRELM